MEGRGDKETGSTPLARSSERPPLTTWHELLSTDRPEELHARLVDGDPLDLLPLGAKRIRERAYLLDAQRIHSLATARIALLSRLAPDRPDPTWLLEHVDFAIRMALRQDQENDRLGIPDPDNPHHMFLSKAFAIEPGLARSAAVAFNLLDDLIRQRFFALLDGRSIDACVQQGLGTREEISQSMRDALMALKLLDDSVHFPPPGGQR